MRFCLFAVFCTFVLDASEHTVHIVRMNSASTKGTVEGMAKAFKTHVADVVPVLLVLETGQLDRRTGRFDSLAAWMEIRTLARRQRKADQEVLPFEGVDDTQVGTLDEVAGVFGVHPGEPALLLEDLGEGFDPITGRLDAERAFNKIRDAVEKEEYDRVNDALDFVYGAGKKRPASIDDISEDPREARAQLKELFEANEAKFIRHELRGGACLVFERPENLHRGGSRQIAIVTYYAGAQQKARSDASSAPEQYNFRVSYLDRWKQYEWIALIVAPLNRVYLKKMSEVREGREGAKSVNITIREGTPSDDLFERRIGELITGEVFEM